MAQTKTPEITSTQKFLQAEQELYELVCRKKQVDLNLAQLETQLYHFENTYLEDTALTGNVIKGFDGYLGLRSEKRRGIRDSDRLFSNSSVTYPKALAMHSETAVTVERPYSPANDVPTSSGDEAVRKRRRRKSNFKASIEDNEDSDDEEFKVGRKNMTTSAVSDEETIN